MRRALLALVLLLALSPSCATRVGVARPQWVVGVTTDAPIPELGDRIRVDILDASGHACGGCSRLLDASSPAAFPLSFGVTDSPAATHVRFRLFRSATLEAGGEPPAASTIDALYVLPPTDGELVDVSATLRVACFGVPADASNGLSCDPTTGALAPAPTAGPSHPTEVGSWPGAKVTPCAGEAPSGTRCVPGGAFVLGDASIEDSTAEAPSPERVVTLPPFFLDEHELTVREYLELRASHSTLPATLSVSTAGDSANCTFASTPNDLPLNCLTKSTAIAICAARGLRLPTEVEWERAAGNGEHETRYPWGNDTDICRYATVAIGGVHGARVCEQPDGPLPPWPLASGGKDVTASGILDLGGSLAEWVEDDFASYGTGCWLSAPTDDPICKGGGNGSVVRGGAWSDPPIQAEAVRRRSLAPSAALSSVGVRCAANDD